MAGRIARIGIVLGIVFALTPLRPSFAGGGGACGGVETSTRATNQIVASGLCFSPTLARVPVGSSVTWTNKDEVSHSVTGANNAWGTGHETTLTTSRTLTLRFTKAGVYPYYCLLHVGMAGAVLVGDVRDILSPNDLVAGSRAVDAAPNTLSASAKTQPSKAGVTPWLAAPIALATAGAGFGWGRRVRNGKSR